MRVCVLGAGAIGGYLGSRLAASGVKTSALSRGATLGALRAEGWRLETDSGQITAPAQATDDAAELGEQDLVLLTVKAQALPAAMRGIGPLLGPETVVLTAMNGVPWWFLAGRRLHSVDPDGSIAAAIPDGAVLGGVVHLAASVIEPGLVRHRRGNELIIGEPDNSDSARVREIAGMLTEAGVDVSVSTEIQKDIWYKLWGNLTINPVSVLTGATTDRILDDELVTAFCASAMVEAQRIGERIGCSIAESPRDRNKVTRKLGVFKSSMLQDAEAGRSLELDALAGAVREIGAMVGVPTPTIDALHGLTRLTAAVRGLGGRHEVPQ